MILEYAGYLADRGHSVTMYAGVVKTDYFINPGIDIKPLSSGFKGASVFKAIVTDFHCDVLIVDIVAMAFLLSFRNRSKLLYIAQDYDEEYYRSRSMRVLIRLLYTVTLCFFKVPSVVVSEKLKNIFTKRYKTIPRLIFNGVDTEVFYPDKDEELLFRKSGKTAVTVFLREDYRKGSDICLDVLKRLGETELKDHAEIWTLGDGWDTKNGFEVKNFGFVKHERLRQILSSSDIFFFPTRHEGFSLLILEAMACGCAIVTTEAVECCQDGVNALVSPIGDDLDLEEKLTLLAGDKDLRERIARTALSNVKEYDIKKSKKELEEYILSGWISNE